MDNIETNINYIQRFVILCVDKEYRLRAYSFSAKLEHLNEKRRQAVVDNELLKTSDELMVLIRHSPNLKSLADHIDNPNSLWDSTFIEIP